MGAPLRAHEAARVPVRCVACLCVALRACALRCREHARTGRQVLADTLGLAVDLPDAKETTSRGVAVLVLEALGMAPAAPVAVASTTLPNAHATRVYAAAKERQDSLYKYHSLATEFTQMRNIPW
jgi:hypothetical protein